MQFTRSYRLEGRVFVLDTPARGLDVAFFTVLRHATRSERDAGDPSSVRLELAHVNLQGRAESDNSTVTFQVPLDGPATLRIPGGTPSGKAFRLDGKGMPSVYGRGSGDLVVRVNVEVPRKLTPRQKELLAEFARFARALQDHPRRRRQRG